MVTYIGLLIIIIGWGIQLLSKERNIQKSFVLIYSLGVILLVIDGFLEGLMYLAILNLVSFLVSIAVFIKISRE
jgi:hypothetical protein